MELIHPEVRSATGYTHPNGTIEMREYERQSRMILPTIYRKNYDKMPGYMNFLQCVEDGLSESEKYLPDDLSFNEITDVQY